MPVVQFEIGDDKLIQALDALRRLGILRPQIFRAMPLPVSPASDAQFEKEAQAIAVAIAPKPYHVGRREALLLVLQGGDTYSAQVGDMDVALRNAIGAISKKLRHFEPFAASPLEKICERRREVFTKGRDKGVFRGIRYIPNRMGQRVLAILREKSLI